MRVYKYIILDVNSEITHIELPKGAEILHVDCQQIARVAMWALVDPKAHKDLRQFVVMGTGHDMPELKYPGVTKYHHVGTALSAAGGALVWHVFEIVTDEDNI